MLKGLVGFFFCKNGENSFGWELAADKLNFFVQKNIIYILSIKLKDIYMYSFIIIFYLYILVWKKTSNFVKARRLVEPSTFITYFVNLFIHLRLIFPSSHYINSYLFLSITLLPMHFIFFPFPSSKLIPPNMWPSFLFLRSYQRIRLKTDTDTNIYMIQQL